MLTATGGCGPVERTTTRAVHNPGLRYALRDAMTSRLIAQTKPASSRAMAAAATGGFLRLRRSERKRPHSRVWAFHAISRTRRGAAATFGCFARPTRAGCFDQDASSSTVPGLGDAATVDLVARGTLRGHEPQVAHKLAWILKAGEITNLGEHSDGSNEIDAAHRLQGRDNLGKRPFGHRLADRLFQTLDALVFLTHPLQKFFEYHALLAILELLGHQPRHMGWPPRLLPRINASQT